MASVGNVMAIESVNDTYALGTYIGIIIRKTIIWAIFKNNHIRRLDTSLSDDPTYFSK